ncbi:hypothetical protein [Riemerella columbina]|uniref:hypothetical protein n=1 Tax=Riemerella columbina TaxID=103810 RepID=UPI00266FE062|nr:hypothetical protein [Riemerella columbina]WKS96128.1 hypothetical protein NYR17_06320 [Riemerella columbina]
MKYILELILTTIVIFFVWNILKRLFFNQFYQYFPHQKNQNKTNHPQQKGEKNKTSNLNWDAETVDYEEVKDSSNR